MNRSVSLKFVAFGEMALCLNQTQRNSHLYLQWQKNLCDLGNGIYLLKSSFEYYMSKLYVTPEFLSLI